MSYRIVAAALLAALGLSARGALAAQPLLSLQDLLWVNAPKGSDLATFYPDRAQRMGKEGFAAVNCTVLAGGALSDCAVATEFPTAFEFGAAAIKITRYYRVSTVDKHGNDIVGRRLAIPMDFKLGGAIYVPGTPQPSPPPAPPLRTSGPAAMIMTAVVQGSRPVAYPIWTAVPSRSTLASLYPERAQRMLKTGFAQVSCTVASDGALGDCRVTDEFSTGFGFGAATIRAAQSIRVSTVDHDGNNTVGRSVLVPIDWKLHGGSVFMAPTPPAQATTPAARP